MSMLMLIGTALAQEPGTPSTSVTVPWGEWVTAAVTTAQPVVTLALTGIVSYIVAAYVPPWLKAFAGDAAQRRVNEVLQKAVASAVAQTKNAVMGRRLTIPVASVVLSRAMQYAVNQAPQLIKTATHDEVANLSKMVLARMEEAGVAPKDFDVAKVKVEGFDFGGAISKGFGK